MPSAKNARSRASRRGFGSAKLFIVISSLFCVVVAIGAEWSVRAYDAPGNAPIPAPMMQPVDR